MPASAYGGQAVMEGVMMRGPAGMAVAVRRGDGSITEMTVRRPLPARGVWQLPVLRGLAALADSLQLGTSALLYSADLAAADLAVAEPELGAPALAGGVPGPAAANADPALGWTFAIAVAIGLGVFVVLPAIVAGLLHRGLHSAALAGLAEGGLRLVLLLGYVGAIGAIGEIRRVLEFHGAEHKAIAAYEAGLPLAPAQALGCSRFHPRCGTSYLLFVVLLAGLIFPLLGWQSLPVRLALRLIVLPVVGGLGFEVLRASARGGALGRLAMAPGLWLQRLTTREPDAAQLEVACRALRLALDLAGG